MKKSKAILILFCTAIFFISFGNMSDIFGQSVGSKSEQTKPKSTQTKTKTKSTQTGNKSAQTKSNTTQTKSNTTKTTPDNKASYPGSFKIGTQIWAAANLNVVTFRNGDTIPEASTAKEWVTAGESGKPAWCYYNNNPAIGLKYGKLYNWFAVNDPRGLAPDGWTLSGDADWVTLINFLGGPAAAGIKMKSTTSWIEDYNGTNDSGFSGFAGGYRVENGAFLNIGGIGIWWSSTENNPRSAVDYYLSHSSSINRSNSLKQRGESVRCIRK